MSKQIEFGWSVDQLKRDLLVQCATVNGWNNRVEMS